MTIYAFTLITAEGSSQSAGVREAASDDDACEIATDLLLESDSRIIEVWRGKWMIYRVSKVDQAERKPPAVSAHRRAKKVDDNLALVKGKAARRG